MKKIIISLLLITLLFVSTILTGCNGEKNNKIEIVVDGGGAFAGYNSTSSQEVSEANPYPYNTLEKLADEYMELNKNIKIKINSSSYDGNRENLIPLLNQRRAPDIIYQNGVVAAEDFGKDYYVVLNDYFDKSNPYVEGNKKWKDIYNEDEFNITISADNNLYFACIDKIVNGIVYNKTIFQQSGITKEPETFKEFMEAQDKINSKYGSQILPFMSNSNTYDLYLECNMLNSLTGSMDVINKNGVVDYQELARGYKKGIFKLDDGRYEDYLSILREKTKYYPNGFEGYDGFRNFISGNVGMLEVVGPALMQISRASKSFEYGYIPFPYVSKSDVSPRGSIFAGKPVIGGGAGLSTGWWVTNSAKRKGQETVDAAVDFLMYVTAPKNNNRMVNDLGIAVPLSADATYPDYFKKPMKIYNADLINPDKALWHEFGSFGQLGTDYYIFFTQKLQDLYKRDGQKGKESPAEIIQKLSPYFNTTINTLIAEREWDVSKW